MNQEPKQKNDYKIIITLLIVFGVIIFIQKTYYSSATSERKMLKSISEINLLCPLMIDGNIRLDSIYIPNESEIIYNYSLIDMIKDSMDIHEFEDYIKPLVISNIKSNPEFRIYKDNNVVISHDYKDKDGETVLLISVSPEIYNEIDKEKSEE